MSALSEKTAALQRWLNHKGANPPLKVDGAGGPVTRATLIETFRCRQAESITAQHIKDFAFVLGCSTRQLATVAAVESAGGGWDSSGMLKCLYERHYMWKRLKIKTPLLSDPAPGGYTVDADGDGVNDSWEKVADGTLKWGAGYAFECASWGKFQIMGAWWQKLGYSSLLEYVYAQTRSEVAQYEALVRYVLRFDLADALRSINSNPANCLAFARGYNGKGQKGYDQSLAQNYTRLAGA